MKNLFKNIKQTDIVNITFAIFSLLILLPFLYAIRYSLPAADDFAMINKQALAQDGIFFTSIKTAVSFYKNWGGGFIGAFLQTFILGFYKTGVNGLHLLLAVLFIFFFYSMFVFYKAFCDKFELPVCALLYFFTLLIGLNTTSPNEFLYWAVGALAYSLFFSTMLLTLACFIKYTVTKHNRYYAGVIVWGILTCNSLPFAGTLNAVILLYLIYSWVKNHKIDTKIAVLFCVVFVMAVIVAFAPGNFARHSAVTSGGMHLPKVLVGSGISVLRELLELFMHSFIGFGAVVLFFAVLASKKESSAILKINPVWIGIVLLGICYIFVFPVCLGYGGQSGMPERIKYAMDFILSFCLYSFVIYFALWTKQNYQPVLKKEFVPFIIMFFFAFFSVQIQAVNVKDRYLFITLKEIASGSMNDFYHSGIDTINLLKNTQDDDVVIHAGKNGTHVLKGIGLTDNPEFWVNQTVATFYAKQSVTYFEE